MLAPHLQRLLVPDAPASKRTQGDVGRDARVLARASLGRVRAKAPGLKTPRLVSTHRGAIRRILFAFPDVSRPALTQAYRSVIAALRPGVEFVVVHYAADRATIAGWFTAAGHPEAAVTFVPLPDYVSFTDWAEDAYVSLNDADDGDHYLMEPWSFLRAGDALIADAVEEYTATRAVQAPLVFQGGNCLISDDTWLLGKDYFADSEDLITGDRPPVELPDGADAKQVVFELFARNVDATRQLKLVGTAKPIPLRALVGRREGAAYFLDIPAGGVGTFQPIFHIDMLATPFAAESGGRHRLLVGDPRMADDLLGVTSPYALADVYDTIAADLAASGFEVIRNPLVHQPTVGQAYTLRQLKDFAAEPDSEALALAVDDLVAAGAQDATNVRVREWHHITWNNCLVEDSEAHGRHVYLPTFGHAPYANLAAIDAHMRELWEGLGYQVHLLADFNAFARRQGVVHCIKKYLSRGD